MGKEYISLGWTERRQKTGGDQEKADGDQKRHRNTTEAERSHGEKQTGTRRKTETSRRSRKTTEKMEKTTVTERPWRRLQDDVIEETKCRADGDERRGKKTSQEPEGERSNGEALEATVVFVNIELVSTGNTT